MKNQKNKILKQINGEEPEFPYRLFLWFGISTIVIALMIELAMRTPVGQ